MSEYQSHESGRGDEQSEGLPKTYKDVVEGVTVVTRSPQNVAAVSAEFVPCVPAEFVGFMTSPGLLFRACPLMRLGKNE